MEEIFRGERYLADEEEEGDSSASANEAVPPASSATVAIVEGLANRKICASRPRIGERRIFFANPMDAVTLVKNIISFFPGNWINCCSRRKGLLRSAVPLLADGDDDDAPRDAEELAAPADQEELGRTAEVEGGGGMGQRSGNGARRRNRR